MMKKYQVILITALILFTNDVFSQNLTWRKHHWFGGRDKIYRINYNHWSKSYFASGTSDFNNKYWYLGTIFTCSIKEDGDTININSHDGMYAGGLTVTNIAADYSILAIGTTYDTISFAETEHIYKFDSLGNIVWDHTYDPGQNAWIRDGFISMYDGGALLVGDRGAFEHDCFAIRFDQDGNVLWEQDYYVPRYQKVYGLTSLKDGSFAITGGDGRPFMLKIDKDGQFLSYDTLLDTSGEGFKMLQLNDGGIIGTYSNDNTNFLVAADSNLNFKWKKSLFDGGFDPELLKDSSIFIRGNDFISKYNIDTGVRTWHYDFVEDSGSFRYLDGAFNDSEEYLMSAEFVRDDRVDLLDTEILLYKFSNIAKPLSLNSKCDNPPQIYWVSAVVENDTVTMEESSEAFLKYNNDYGYQWWLQDGRIFYDSTVSFEFDQTEYPDTFWVSLVITDGIFCTDTMTINVYNNEVLNNPHLGIKKQIQPRKIKKLAIIPNPTREDFTIYSPVLKEKGVSLEIYDLAGQLVSSSSINNLSGSYKMDTKYLEKGLYMVVLRNKGNLIARNKLIISG